MRQFETHPTTDDAHDPRLRAVKRLSEVKLPIPESGHIRRKDVLNFPATVAFEACARRYSLDVALRRSERTIQSWIISVHNIFSNEGEKHYWATGIGVVPGVHRVPIRGAIIPKKTPTVVPSGRELVTRLPFPRPPLCAIEYINRNPNNLQVWSESCNEVTHRAGLFLPADHCYVVFNGNHNWD
jgi:hypothetical protein